MTHEPDSVLARLRLGHVLVFVASILIVFTWNSFTMLNDNVTSRLATVDSLAERHTVQIDDSKFVRTSDKVFVNGHFYSEKPPLLSLLATVVYLPIRALGFTFWNSTFAYFAITFGLSGVSFLICLVCFYDALLRVGLDDTAATWMTAMLGLGTLCLSFSTALNNHSFPASWLFIGMYFLLRARDSHRPLWMWAAGCSFALAVGADTSTALLVAGFGVYVLLESSLRRRALAIVIPCAVVLAAGAAYNYAICGSLRPMQVTPQYFDYPGGHFAPGGEPLTGITRNPLPFALNYLGQLLFGWNGFLLYSPLLLFAIAAAIITIVRRRALWKLAVAVLVTSAGYVVYYALYSSNFAGCSYSIRWYVAFVPILFFFAFPILQEHSKWIRVAFACGFAVSIPVALLGAVDPWSCGAPSILFNLSFWRSFLLDLGASLVLAAVVFYLFAIISNNRTPRVLHPSPALVAPRRDEAAAEPPLSTAFNSAVRQFGGSAVNTRTWLAAILLVAFVLRLAVTIALPHSAYFDEVFQSREQAHRLVFGYGAVPWEFREGVRNWLFPAFLAGVTRATAWAGPGSWGYGLGIDAVLSLLSLTLVWIGFRWAYRVAGLAAAILAGTICAVWYDLIYFAPQALSDVVAAYALLPGLYLGYFAISPVAPGVAARRLPQSEVAPSLPNSAVRQFGSSAMQPNLRLFFSGALLGLALALRIQLAPAVLVALVWLCRKHARRWALMLLGLAIPLACFGIVDAFTWGYPFASYVNAVDVNMLHHKSNVYGTEPATWYFTQIAARFGVLLLLAFAGARRAWFLASVAATVLLMQLFFAHKEYRFIFAVVPILCILVGLAIASAWKQSQTVTRASVAAAIAVIVIASVTWGGWQNAEEQERALRSDPSDRAVGLWHSGTPHIHAFRELSTRSDVCGVATVNFRAGFFHLHHDVPVYLLVKIDPQQFAGFNYLEAPKDVGDDFTGYHAEKCWRDFCLYRRDGGCTSTPGYTVRQLMREMNR